MSSAYAWCRSFRVCSLPRGCLLYLCTKIHLNSLEDCLTVCGRLHSEDETLVHELKELHGRPLQLQTILSLSFVFEMAAATATAGHHCQSHPLYALITLLKRRNGETAVGGIEFCMTLLGLSVLSRYGLEDEDQDDLAISDYQLAWEGMMKGVDFAHTPTYRSLVLFLFGSNEETAYMVDPDQDDVSAELLALADKTNRERLQCVLRPHDLDTFCDAFEQLFVGSD